MGRVTRTLQGKGKSVNPLSGNPRRKGKGRQGWKAPELTEKNSQEHGEGGVA